MRKQQPIARVVRASVLMAWCGVLFAQQPQLPPNYPKAQYDELKVPQYTLPDPLVLLDGKKVKDIKTWEKKRRPEILKLFETYVYGRTMAGRPKEMKWEITAREENSLAGSVRTKDVTIYFAGKRDGPSMQLHITLPMNAKGPAPIFLVPGIGSRNPEKLISRGYGLANFNPSSIEPDNVSGYAKSIRSFFAKPGQKELGPDEWGAIGAWAWGMSRAMDYLVTDPDIDAKKVGIMGVSRYGKVAMWAGAQDQRFAIVFSAESGCGGANIVRRQYGETIRAITNQFPYWFDGHFKEYADRVNDLPVDWHMLIALMAPRPVYIATAEQDYWGDPRGSFLAAKFAERVYRLYGLKGLGVDDMPPVETPVGDMIGYHDRKGAHGLNDYDWQQFMNSADRHFGIGANTK